MVESIGRIGHAYLVNDDTAADIVGVIAVKEVATRVIALVFVPAGILRGHIGAGGTITLVRLRVRVVLGAAFSLRVLGGGSHHLAGFPGRSCASIGFVIPRFCYRRNGRETHHEHNRQENGQQLLHGVPPRRLGRTRRTLIGAPTRRCKRGCPNYPAPLARATEKNKTRKHDIGVSFGLGIAQTSASARTGSSIMVETRRVPRATKSHGIPTEGDL